MNTDNMSIHGITIDYGPYGWLEPFEVDWTPNTTDAGRRRYRYGNQPHIGAWNVARLLESMAPLMEDVGRLQPVLDHCMEFAMNAQSETWADKLGLGGLQESDEELVNDLLVLLGSTEVDMTMSFEASAPWPNRMSTTFQRRSTRAMNPQKQLGTHGWLDGGNGSTANPTETPCERRIQSTCSEIGWHSWPSMQRSKTTTSRSLRSSTNS